jgi:hypothetical protein
MASNNNIENNIIQALLQLRDEHRVSDTWHSADTIASILNVPTMALNKALSKSAEFAQIDIQDGSNNCGIVRFQRQMPSDDDNNKRVRRHFLFFPHRKQPTFFKATQTWSNIYQKSAQFKLAPRSKQARIVSPMRTSDDTAAFSLPQPPKKRRCRHVTTAAPIQFDIFNDTKTKTLFNAANRDEFIDRVTRMRTAVQQHKVSPFLSMPHKKRKNERLPEYNVLFLFSKRLALTIAY